MIHHNVRVLLSHVYVAISVCVYVSMCLRVYVSVRLCVYVCLWYTIMLEQSCARITV